MNQFLEENEYGKTPDQLKVAYKMPEIRRKHSLHQLVDSIMEATGDDKKNYPFWCKKVSDSKVSANSIIDLCETAKTLPEKYSKAGYIRNRL